MTPFVSSWIIADAYHLSYISMASSDSQDFISIIIPCHEIEKKILALTFFFHFQEGQISTRVSHISEIFLGLLK